MAGSGAGFFTLDYYRSFAAQVHETKRRFLTFLIKAKRAGKSVAGKDPAVRERPA